MRPAIGKGELRAREEWVTRQGQANLRRTWCVQCDSEYDVETQSTTACRRLYFYTSLHYPYEAASWVKVTNCGVKKTSTRDTLIGNVLL
jgi:hypothetical protein